MMMNLLTSVATLLCISLSYSVNTNDTAEITKLQAKVADLEKQLAAFKAQKALVDKNIDLQAFAHHDMELIAQLHADNVTVIKPDGSVTKGMTPAHRAELQWLFDTYPDVNINSHPLTVGSGDWTAGSSHLTGNWTKPMKMMDGTVCKPPGKSSTSG